MSYSTWSYMLVDYITVHLYISCQTRAMIFDVRSRVSATKHPEIAGYLLFDTILIAATGDGCIIPVADGVLHTL
jgi:hypothetical protein